MVSRVLSFYYDYKHLLAIDGEVKYKNHGGLKRLFWCGLVFQPDFRFLGRFSNVHLFRGQTKLVTIERNAGELLAAHTFILHPREQTSC